MVHGMSSEFLKHGNTRKKNELGRATKRSFSEGTVDDMNKARKAAEVPPIVVKMRSCLSCDKKFESLSPGNRMCSGCSQRKEVIF